MTGGKSALWVDEDIADIITGKAKDFIVAHKTNLSSCIWVHKMYTFPESPIRVLQGKRFRTAW